MSAAIERYVLQVLAPLDAVRGMWLHWVGRWAPRLLRVRSERVAIQAALFAATALVLALRAPWVLLSVGPLVLGVPHLISDYRYLVVRQGLARQPRLWVICGPCLVAALCMPGVGWGMAAIAGAALVANGPLWRRLFAAGSCMLAAWCASAIGPHADVLFAHGHNLVAIACWAAWARGSRLQLLPALAICSGGCALIFSGAADGLVWHSQAPVSLDVRSLVTSLAPTQDPRWALRWTLCFAFMQSVHYGVWLRSLPEEDRARPGLRPIRSSYRALVRELGPFVLAAAALLMLALWVTAGFDITLARDGYLRLALFHGPLELSVLAVLWVERRAPLRAG